MKESHVRSLVKGFTWRIIGTMDTIMLSFIITGHIETALKIGFTEFFTKIVLYYLHERIWFKFKIGLAKVEKHDGTVFFEDKRWKSLIKGISWRFFGTMDTIILATFWTGDYSKAFGIGFAELFSKIFLYYLHERIWSTIKWAREPDIIANSGENVKKEIEIEKISNIYENDR
jgi:uncharacterized membrane protein